MGYISVLASHFPPRSGGMIPFSNKHYHHDITSRSNRIIVVVVDTAGAKGPIGPQGGGEQPAT